MPRSRADESVVLLRAFACTLRAERERQQLSQKAFADRAGLREAHIRMLERGNTNPQFTTLCKLADGLGMDFIELVNRAVAEVPREQTRFAYRRRKERGGVGSP
jgi:transcriptional regulator with XRE-family HTH domain